MPTKDCQEFAPECGQKSGRHPKIDAYLNPLESRKVQTTYWKAQIIGQILLCGPHSWIRPGGVPIRNELFWLLRDCLWACTELTLVKWTELFEPLTVCNEAQWLQARAVFKGKTIDLPLLAWTTDRCVFLQARAVDSWSNVGASNREERLHRSCLRQKILSFAGWQFLGHVLGKQLRSPLAHLLHSIDISFPGLVIQQLSNRSFVNHLKDSHVPWQLSINACEWMFFIPWHDCCEVEIWLYESKFSSLVHLILGRPDLGHRKCNLSARHPLPHMAAGRSRSDTPDRWMWPCWAFEGQQYVTVERRGVIYCRLSMIGKPERSLKHPKAMNS